MVCSGSTAPAPRSITLRRWPAHAIRRPSGDHTPLSSTSVDSDSRVGAGCDPVRMNTSSVRSWRSISVTTIRLPSGAMRRSHASIGSLVDPAGVPSRVSHRSSRSVVPGAP